MKKHLIALAAALFLLPAIAEAQQAKFPQTMPPNTVVGRTGISAGPAQAIPFDVLRTFVGSAVTIGGAAGPTFTLDPTLKVTGAQLGVVVGTSGSTIPLNSGNNIFSGTNTFSGSNTFNGTVTLPNQAAYSWLLNNSGSSAPPTPVTIGALTLNSSPNSSTTTLPCETGGVLGKCTAGSLAGSLTTGITSIGGSSGPSISLDSGSLSMTSTTLAVKTGTSGHTIPYLDGTLAFGGTTVSFSGDVGVGTASPAKKFEVSSANSAGTELAVTNTNGGTNRWTMQADPSGGSLQIVDRNTPASRLQISSGGTVSLGGSLLVGSGLRIGSPLSCGALNTDGSGNVGCGSSGSITGAVYVSNYAVCDGSTDDTTALQNAINAVTSGAMLIFPAGKNCRTTSSLVISAKAMFIQGNHSTLYTTANINVLTIDTTAGALSNVNIDGLWFLSTGTSTARGILVSGSNTFSESRFTDLRIYGFYDGIAFTAYSAAILIDSCSIGGVPTVTGIRVTTGGMGQSIISNNRIGTGSVGAVNIYMQGPIGDMTITGNQLEGYNTASPGATKCLFLNATVYGGQFQVAGNKMDTCVQGIEIYGVSNSAFTSNGFVNPLLQDGVAVTANDISRSGSRKNVFVNTWN